MLCIRMVLQPGKGPSNKGEYNPLTLLCSFSSSNKSNIIKSQIDTFEIGHFLYFNSFVIVRSCVAL